MDAKVGQAASGTPLNSPAARHAKAALLSLALMDSRNRTLALYTQIEAALASQASYPVAQAMALGLQPPLWNLGYLGWYQERWTSRNLQWRQGRRADRTQPVLGSIEPMSDALWPLGDGPSASPWNEPLPSSSALRAYLLETLELSLGLLEKAGEDDDALYFFRHCLFHEDQMLETRLEEAQMLGLPLGLPSLPVMTPREPMAIPACRWTLGTAPGGYVPDNEAQAHLVQVPEFEIDAQPVTWAQYAEFVNDGGYDQQDYWSDAGWAWLQSTEARPGREGGQRAPRYVEQIGSASGAVLQTRFGQTTRMAGSHPVMHVSAWEADAYARWAGRRLPAEVEWEVAAMTASRLGWRWGEVNEWTASTYRSYPGYAPGPCATPEQERLWGVARTVRGASFATPERLQHPKRRFGALHAQDELFIGFRTCAP